MEPEVKQNFTTPKSSADLSDPDSGVITKLSSSESGKSSEEWQKIAQQLNTFMQEFPGFLEEFWSNYKLPVTVFGLFLGIIVVLKVLFAVLGAINELPFLSPTFELIGIGYAGWFILRYLLRGSSRQELGDNINSVKDQVLGSREKLLDRLSSKGDE